MPLPTRIVTAFQRTAFQLNAFQIDPNRAPAWTDDSRRQLRQTIKPRQLDKILKARHSWPTDVKRAYAPIQNNIDEIESMGPLELATEELAWRLEQRDQCLRLFRDTNENHYRLRAEGLERRINWLYTEIYRLKLIADIEQQKVRPH